MGCCKDFVIITVFLVVGFAIGLWATTQYEIKSFEDLWERIVSLFNAKKEQLRDTYESLRSGPDSHRN